MIDIGLSLSEIPRRLDPIFIQTEEGAGNLELTTFAGEPFTEFRQVEEAIELLYSGDHKFRTVVVDSLDWLEPIIWAETCRRHSTDKVVFETIEDFDYGKGYLEELQRQADAQVPF